jgi:hypothetical protein
VIAACGKDTTGPLPGVARADLLAVAMFDSAPPFSHNFVSFKKNQLTTFQVKHSDSTQTVLATFTFAPFSIVSRNDTVLADTSTIIVTIDFTPGDYEFTVGPAGLGFNVSSEPTVEVSYGRYGDLSVYTQSARYASAQQFSAAAELWRERTTDHWVMGRNSAHTGLTTVASALESPGHYLLAAPK